MLIVAIDTSGRNGSVALCRGDESNFELLGMTALEGGTYSARLVPCIADLLRLASVDKSHIDGVAVVDGPGSFTGLRIGLSTAKALCQVMQKPLATVSMLEALALTHGREGGVVTSVLDAGRGEMYIGKYEISGDSALLRAQSVWKLTDFLPKLSSLQSRIVTTYPKVSGAAVVEPLSADSIARIGLRKLLAGDIADAVTLDANYIRRSDAELFSRPKS
ncbi:MAG TPA: tRNA (adenosine(37)-N6)-threonylcarbamoyltransferase complex dimerization subunit type 1 TsaB [Candidatus Angelobacter sp.]|nr:tRNA (adenosine(37)-N6)-threonylcarbamoyltransferase complex dimerization subunit type 1 TsaB [Candidatus Angelobacter sp.]